MADLAREARLWSQKWLWYERNTLPWNRARIHWELMRREAFARWPVHGNVLEALREGRLEVGSGVLLEPGVWITAPGSARVRIGTGTFLNMGVMVAAHELVEIGAINIGSQPAFNISGVLPDDSGLGLFLRALLGYSSSPEVITLVVYFLYLVPVLWYYLRPVAVAKSAERSAVSAG